MTSQFIGATALMKAAGAGRRNMVELLLDRGADLEAKTEVTPGPVLLRDSPRWAPRAGHKPRWRSCGGMACWGRGPAGSCAGGTMCRSQSLRARGLAGWRYGAGEGGTEWPQGYCGTAAGPGRRSRGQNICNLIEDAAFGAARVLGSWAGRGPRWRAGRCDGVPAAAGWRAGWSAGRNP